MDNALKLEPLQVKVIAWFEVYNKFNVDCTAYPKPLSSMRFWDGFDGESSRVVVFVIFFWVLG